MSKINNTLVHGDLDDLKINLGRVEVTQLMYMPCQLFSFHSSIKIRSNPRMVGLLD